MTLLLAQPDTVTDTWKPLALWINRMMWAWSPWHLRELLSVWVGKAEWAMRVAARETRSISYNHAVDRDRLEMLTDEPGFRRFLDAEAANSIGHLLLQGGYITKTEERLPWDGSVRTAYRLLVPPAPPPKEIARGTA